MRQKYLTKLWAKIMRSLYREFAGGTTYGFDWNTLAVIAPQRHAVLKSIQAELQAEYELEDEV